MFDIKNKPLCVTNRIRKYENSIFFKTMIGWICVRHSDLLSEWLFRILKKLHSLNKNSVLIEVTHLTIEKVTEL